MSTYHKTPVANMNLTQPPSQYERIVSVLREFPEVRNIRAIAEALDKALQGELSK